jgi:Lon protease-like protein
MLSLLATPVSWSISSPLPLGRPVRHARCATLLMAETPEVRWLQPIDPSQPDAEPSSEDATTMPLFPLGVTYLPYTTTVLNIFEPRYRKMYNDILFNGARRFAVVNVDAKTGRFAEVGVIFYLDELKEVSEQTDDRVKYIGTHSVKGRVQIKKVLNPKDGATRETYLKAEVADFEDDDDGGAGAEAEKAVEDRFIELVELQGKLGEEPRFTEAVKSSLLLGPGSSPDDRGLWGTIALWQQFLEQRTAVMGQKMQRDIQKGVVSYLKTNSLQDELVNARGEVRMEDLPAPLLQEIRGIQERYREEIEAMDADPYGLNFQTMLQAHSHAERLELFGAILDQERKRLGARATLQAMFASDKGSD